MSHRVTGISIAALIATLWIAVPASAQDGPPRHKPPYSMMKAADTDGDGRISRAEADAQRGKMFSDLDEDGDGAISRDLFVSQKTDRIMKRMSRENIEKRVGRRFDKIDQDGDKSLSLGEFNSRGQGHFDRMDRDGDGYISQGEHPRRGRYGGGGKHR
jgi:Ca2+-binding EF-hand superfamily protein